MTTAELQLQLHQAIDATTDSEKLKAIYSYLKEPKGPYKPMSKEEYIAAIDQARKEIMNGKYQDIDDLEKESDNW